ncbi:glycosyltransferase family 4 protein [uncultured Bacteroides sp.]|uniref:glycosyltransferase n=1 Tax=uncultured Bacteroides sp. TaxID=162156 RepID=UPI0025964933|nr:glycosyltransferase family 4 protein [uncultured Bacteroides sp.]
MRMKVLFISRDYRLKKDGGSAVVKRNLNLLKSLFNEVTELIIPIPSVFTRIKNVVRKESYGSTSVLMEQVNRYLKEHYDLVFFDSSLYGGYLKLFAENKFKTCCFYHNIEYKYYKDKYAVSKKLQDRMMIPYVKYNEKLSTMYATYRITLNERDSLGLHNTYGKKADFLLPTSFDPVSVESLNQNVIDNELPYVLFVGSKFFANVEALEFLFKEVAPYLNCTIKIVGSVCNAFRNRKIPENVILVGVVDDLSPYYVNACCVVAPIFSGSGLKTKTIEALRYGKNIVGTKECFEGISQQYYPMIGKLCITATDFITAINDNSFEKLNTNSLNLFKDLYSNKAQEDRFKSFLMENIYLKDKFE